MNCRVGEVHAIGRPVSTYLLPTLREYGETHRHGDTRQDGKQETDGVLLHQLLDKVMDMAFFRNMNPDTGKLYRALPYAEEEHPTATNNTRR